MSRLRLELFLQAAVLFGISATLALDVIRLVLYTVIKNLTTV